MSDVVLKIVVLMYDLTLLAGTAYFVQFHNWSMWTFALAALFFITTKDATQKHE
jgi:hypothetical protein